MVKTELKRIDQIHILDKAEQFALQYLVRGRAVQERSNWDIPHTFAVVHYAGLLAQELDLDPLVMKIAALLHDIGYFDLFDGEQSLSYEEIRKRKKLHMDRGAQYANKFLFDSEIAPLLTPQQKALILHLIRTHDNFDEPDQHQTLYEIAFMEADTLGALDMSRVPITFDYKSGTAYIKEGLGIRRIPRFKTELGNRLLQELLPKFVTYIESLAH